MKNSLKESHKMSLDLPKRKDSAPLTAKKQLSKITNRVQKRSGNSLLKITPRKSTSTKSKIHQLAQSNDCEGLTKFLSTHSFFIKKNRKNLYMYNLN